MPAAMDKAREICKRGPLVLRYLKACMNAQEDFQMKRKNDLEVTYTRYMARHKDFNEGVTAFLEKREPAVYRRINSISGWHPPSLHINLTFKKAKKRGCNMKKRLLAALLASAMALSLAACGNTDTGADNGGDAAANGGSSNEPVVLKMNSIKTTSDPMYEAWSNFCDRINEAANGTLDVQIYPSESLGATTDVIESISKGAPLFRTATSPTWLTTFRTIPRS